MRPDKELCPGRVTVAPRLCRGWMNRREKGGKKEKRGVEKMGKSGLFFGGDVALQDGAIY